MKHLEDAEKETTIFKKMDCFMNFFSTITQEESDFIDRVLMWDTDTKMAFTMAKSFFEDG